MLNELLQILEIDSVDKHPLQLPESLAEIEAKIAFAILQDQGGITGMEEVIAAEVKDFKAEEMTTIAAMLRKGNPYQLSIFEKLKNKLAKGISPDVLAEAIIGHYQIDAGYVDYICNTVHKMDALIQSKGEAEGINLPDSTWTLQQARLARRSILLGLAEQWDEDHCGEPILWKCRERLINAGRTPSEIYLAETFFKVAWLGMQKHVGQKKDTLRDFLVKANDEKNKLLLDNLVLSKQTYDTLMESGWQPDRWEVENLPMTIELFLDYMKKAGFIQENEIGEEFDITLEEALHGFRYNGTPFIEKSDVKKVKVLAPGWSYQGELIIQPKVREIKS